MSHFLWTHVFAEKLLIATLRHLDERHPVRWLLAPHLEAARALLAELERLQDLMVSREPGRPWPYRVGHPARVSNSINA